MNTDKLIFWIIGFILSAGLGLLIYFYGFWIPIKSLLITIGITLIVAGVAMRGTIKMTFSELIIGLAVWFIIIYILILNYLI